MDMQDILHPNAIRANLKTTSKKRLFKEIGLFGETLLNVPCGDLQDALIEREDLGTTAMGQGIAIPHARIEGLEKVCGAFIRLDEPIDFDASDRQPVDLVFVLFAPKGDGSEHLRALARISRVLRDKDTQSKLRSTDEVEALYAILTENQNSVAA